MSSSVSAARGSQSEGDRTRVPELGTTVVDVGDAADLEGDVWGAGIGELAEHETGLSVRSAVAVVDDVGVGSGVDESFTLGGQVGPP